MQATTKLEREIDYQFRDSELLQLALTHRSIGSNNNERLEFLGDGLIGFVVADRLFTTFPQINEGKLSQFRSKLVNKQALAGLARQIRLGDYLHLGPGELKSGGFDRDSILEDGFEALVGAIYLDGGTEPARRFLQSIFDPLISGLNPDIVEKDPKTSLQEYLAAQSISHPSYQVVDTTGPPHDRRFTVRCTVQQIDVFADGTGKSVRRAEQAAATAASEVLRRKKNK